MSAYFFLSVRQSTAYMLCAPRGELRLLWKCVTFCHTLNDRILVQDHLLRFAVLQIFHKNFPAWSIAGCWEAWRCDVAESSSSWQCPPSVKNAHLISVTVADKPRSASISAAAKQSLTLVPYPTNATSLPCLRTTPLPSGQAVPFRLAATPYSARLTPWPLPLGNLKQDGRSLMETAVATALQSSASLEGCRWPYAWFKACSLCNRQPFAFSKWHARRMEWFAIVVRHTASQCARAAF